MEPYLNRSDAGKKLAEMLGKYAHDPAVIILALPRGGVPVAYEIAQKLSLPLSVFIVRKLGVPQHEELAMGAIASGGVSYLNIDLIKDLAISPDAIEAIQQKELAELKRREILYRGNSPFPIIKNKKIILVDDGIATGASMRVAIQALRMHQPEKIVIAVPVVAFSTYQELSTEAEEIVCLLKPVHLNAVGSWYINFTQTTDEEVLALLQKR